MNLSTIKKHFQVSSDSFIIGLKREIKGEANKQDYLFYYTNVILSGIKTREWIKLLITVHTKARR